MTSKIFQYIQRTIYYLFYLNKKEIYSKEFIKKISEKTLSQGTFKFFTPEYTENGVFLSIRDKKGLINHLNNKNSKKDLEEKIVREEKQNFLREDKKTTNENYNKFQFEEGFKKTQEYLSKIYSRFVNDYDSISLKFSKEYSRWKYFSSGKQLNFVFGNV